ncbi:MAG: hypothetical protein HOE45_02535 [Gammaproteobacteria bacterium]|nr:hypothetical protein [Gammaproteobacteria bacterium]MBT5222443.1 hypothetical protein [Gammaproteobacteria bacterium]
MRVWLILITVLITSGCKTIDYSPHVYDTPTEAMRVIYQTLEEQQDDHTPYNLEVSESKIVVFYSERASLVGVIGKGAGVERKFIRYSSIGKVTLRLKNKWYTIILATVNGHELLHVHTADIESAERFIDAIETMRHHVVIKSFSQ